MAATLSHPAAADVQALDPYAFMAVIGKRVIHPGGRRSTEELFQRADIQPRQQVLDIGCGVGTTAITMARRFGLCVTAADISPLMRERAAANVRLAGLAHRVRVEEADITAPPYPDGAFDRVMAEAVNMFVDRKQATRELVRVCRPGGRVLATEFLWRRPPTAEARRVFFGEVCPGMTFDTLDDWVRVYRAAGLAEVQTSSGPFEMMTPGGFLGDEGFVHCLAIAGRALSRPAYLRKMAWLMPRIDHAVPYLGYIAVDGKKPA
jgi:SAM-dependent methyltransferase